ncbi:MAG: caspase family protein [Saprospiraceae bacterium]
MQGQPLTAKGIYTAPHQPLLASDGSYVIQSGCIQGDCENGQGVYLYADGSRYEGAFLGGRPHGQGLFRYPNGDTYNGQFAYGLPHGQGRRTYSDGRLQEGRWVEGGFMESPTLFTGSGCINGNCQDGYGVFIFPKGDRYEGTFLNGQPHGHGLVRYQNGDRYEGQMQAGAFFGYGTFYQASGAVFEGRWQSGQYMGNTRTTSSTVVSPTPSVQVPEVKIWAVIVGVAAYTAMPALRFPDDDAYRLFAFLKSPQGGAIPDERIRVLIDEDATRERILQSMQQLFMQAGPNDLVILYFSGHGLPGAFLPIDYTGTEHTLSHAEIRSLLDRSPAGYKLCLADACHSGGLFAAKGEQLPNLLNRYYTHLANARKGTALIMSSKAAETSLESSGLRQGVFSHFLLRGMKGEADADADGVVRVQELFDYISQQVQSYTRQQQSPVIQGNYDSRMPVAILR